MNHHVFDFSELPAHLSVLGASSDSGDAEVVVRAPLSKVSPAGGILNAQVKVERDRLLDVSLELPGFPPRTLQIQVLKASQSGVFFAWYPPSDELHEELELALAQSAEETSDTVSLGAAHENREVSPRPDEPSVANGTSSATGPSERNSDQRRHGSVTQSGGAPAGARPVNAEIRGRARQMNALELAARHRTVHVLELSTIEKLLDQAVTEAAGRLQKQLTREDEERLRRETEERFEERMAILKAEKTSLADQVQTLEDQRTKAEDLLEQERQRVIRSTQFTVSDAGMIQLEQRLSRILDSAVRGKEVAPSLEEDLRTIFSSLLDEEREKIAEQARLAQSDAIDLLERKVERLAETLEQTRSERDVAKERALALENAHDGSPLVQAYQPGLAESDPERSAKLGLLKQLMEDNKELRAFVATRDGE